MDTTPWGLFIRFAFYIVCRMITLQFHAYRWFLIAKLAVMCKTFEGAQSGYIAGMAAADEKACARVDRALCTAVSVFNLWG